MFRVRVMVRIKVGIDGGAGGAGGGAGGLFTHAFVLIGLPHVWAGLPRSPDTSSFLAPTQPSGRVFRKSGVCRGGATIGSGWYIPPTFKSWGYKGVQVGSTGAVTDYCFFVA